MPRGLLLALLLAASGCGVQLKSTATKKPTPDAAKQKEVYDKVAPMPREARPERAKGESKREMADGPGNP